MKKLTHIFFVFSVALMWQCKKQKLPETITEEPRFYLNCNIDGVPSNIKVGDNNYHMFSSNFFDSSSKLLAYKGEFKQKGCTSDCDYAVSVILNDVNPGVKSMVGRVDSVFLNGIRSYNDNGTQPIFYESKFIPSTAYVPNSTYLWTVDDGTQKTTYTTYSIAPTLLAGKKYSVSLRYTLANGSCSEELSNVFKTTSSFQSNLNVVKIGSGNDFTYRFSAQPSGGKAPYRYVWNFGDGSIFNTTEHTLQHQFSTQFAPYLTKLYSIDANNDTCITAYQAIASLEKKCDANFTSSVTAISNSKIYGSITVLLTDKNGDVYSSNGFTQPADSKFEILSFSPYLFNENGEPTVMIKARFNCMLKKGNLTKNIDVAEGMFAISYKP